MLGIVRMPRADMAERIDDALVGQDTIGGYQFFQNEIESAHAMVLPTPICSGSTPRDSTADLGYGMRDAFLEGLDVAALGYGRIVRGCAAARSGGHSIRGRLSRPSDPGDRVSARGRWRRHRHPDRHR